jgi:hypothetical protein
VCVSAVSFRSSGKSRPLMYRFRACTLQIGPLIVTLGLKIVLIEDEAATARTLALRVPVDQAQQRFGNVCRLSTKLLEKPSQPTSPPLLTVVSIPS